jgi:hypothetical protein
MKRYLGLIVGLVSIVVGGIAIYNRVESNLREAESQTDFSRIQRLYAERAGWIRSIPDEKAYKDEVTTFLRWYFKEIDAHQTRYGGNKNFDTYLKELSERATAPAAKDQEIADRKAYYEYTRKYFDMLKGNYAPLWSASDKGMRLDVATVETKTVMGKPQIVMGVVLWGAQRDMRDEGRSGTSGSIKKMVTSASFNVVWKLYDEKDKLYGEMTAPGDPSMKIDWPERFIPEFPPQMVLGYYAMDLLPAEATKMEVEFHVSSRAPSGGEAAANFVWKMDVPAEWKLKAGEKWEGAEDSVRPEDEIKSRTTATKAP